jgi:hypothetical protein
MNELNTRIERVQEWRKIALASAIATILGMCATVGVMAFRPHRCNEDSQMPVWSPDGKWGVTS